MAKSKDSLDYVDDMLKNETVVSQSIKKQRLKRAPAAQLTEKDLELSGWNPRFDENDKSSWKRGDIITVSKEQREKLGLPREAGVRVQNVPSLYSMASVYDPYHRISGYGVCVSDAVKDCFLNISNWRDNIASEADLERTNNLWLTLCSAAIKPVDKDVVALLDEQGL